MPFYLFSYFPYQQTLLAIFLSFFFLTNSFAQIKFRNDKKYNIVGANFLKESIFFESQPEKGNLEFRFWVIASKECCNELYSFYYDAKKNSWTLKYYAFSTWDWKIFNNTSFASFILNSSWEKTWDSLVSYSILTLPTQSSVQKKWKSSLNIFPLIVDGTNYFFEFFSGTKKRGFTYHSPEAYLSVYDQNNSELVSALKIIDTIKDYLASNVKR